MDNFILIREENGVVTLTINRPKALNAINRKVMQELHSFFSTGYNNYDKLLGVIITGSGSKAFVAGADIKEFGDLDERAGADLSKFGHDTYFLIENFHVPVIAAVNGFALGGGCELAMACHMRIASENARFGQPEVNLGLIPGYGGTQRLIQLIGKGKAIELLLTADMIDAQDALKFGLVNHVVPPDTECEMAEKIIQKIGSKGPEAVKKTIALVSAHFSGQKEAFDLEYKEFGKAIASDEAKEGAAAFLQKRKANFQR
jgi:enoyl-CoA hydratase